MPGTELEKLASQIAREEARLREIDAAQAAATQRLEALSAKPVMLQRPDPCDPVSPQTNAQKVALFRSLFRGRADVFPKHWQNPNKQTRGSAPACANEWVRGVCEKPRVKCGECPNQAFIAVTDQVIIDHLRGRHIAGVYPLLEDETCCFLALDFDKADWKNDCEAFRSTCKHFGLNAAVERSRSGKGAHVWFFFAAPVPASEARTLGCYMITETMTHRDQARAQLNDIPDNEERLILATGRFIGEGFDDARLDTLFLAMPISWKGTLLQYAGRLYRRHPFKSEVRIYDYVDADVPMLAKMYQRRLKGYRAMGYVLDRPNKDDNEGGGNYVVEYDQDVMQSLGRETF